MNKIFKSFTFIASVAMIFVACKKENFAVDVDPLKPGPWVKFNVKALGDTAAIYYIKSSGETFNVPIGVTDVADVDRVVNLCYTSNKAAQGVQYNAPATVTIKAGETLDTLRISGLFSGYPLSSRIDTLFVKICGGDVPVSAYQNNMRLIMRKYCEVNLSALAGDYDNVIDNGNYGPYSMTMTPVSTTGTTGVITVDNLWDPGAPVTTTVNLDWTNAAAFSATIEDQVFYGPANWWVRKTTTAGSFSSCDQTFTLRYQLYNKSTGAILYNNQVTVMKR